MANRKLNSIKFPDIADTYILDADKVNYDDSETYASGSVGKALQNKADNDGSYSNMTVGNAEQLVSNVKVNDKTPYLFRTSGGSVDIGDREYVNGIVGGTVAWNQLLTASEGTSKTAQYAGMMPDVNINVINEHKYLLSFLQPAGCRVYSQSVTNLTVGSKSYPAPTTDTLQGRIVTATATALTYMGAIISKSETTETAYKLTECMFIDLTQMFGSTIADYILALETATAGAGVAWFKKLFNKPYYAYNAGELKSVSGLVSHDMTGFNQWDEEWELGTLPNPSSTTQIRSKNFIPVLPDTNYYWKASCSNGVKFYDEDFNAVPVNYNNNAEYAYVASNAVFKTADKARYMKFWCSADYGTTYNNDICINISWDGSRNGEYEPYVKHSYPLDSDLTLRGIPKLDANNSLYYDGDVYAPSGEVTRKYGVVDLGTLTWTLISSGLFYTNGIISLAKTGQKGLITAKYVTLNESFASADASGYADKIIAWNANNAYLYIKDTAYSDASTLKTALNGVYLIYELATPTTETADPYQQTQIVNDFGTEEYVIDSDTFAVPVGSDTDYPVNLVAKLEMAPNSPEGNGDYIVRQVNGENSYVPLVIEDALPTIPSTAGSYKLTVTVTEGSDPVLSWTAE